MLEEGEIVLCTVDRIIGTNVFVKIDSENSKEGVIVFSEVAPGRIRNIRDYVVPQKKIVCKVLRISSDGERVDLSLRRVTQEERKKVINEYNLEKNYENVLKNILKENSSEAIEKIKKIGKIYDFLAKSLENSAELEKIIGKSNTHQILEIIKKQQKKKKVELKKEFSLTSKLPNGLILIKKILGEINDREVRYIAGGRYTIKTESEDLKKADNKLREILFEIEKKAKASELEFNIIKK